MKTLYKTIIVSDVHLGTKGSKAKEIVRFLKQFQCENLILNGDIIDGWQLKKSGRWKRKHTRFFNVILKMIESQETRVYYLRGNHDDFLDQILPLQIGKLHILSEMTYQSHGKSYFITHGDVFDSITTNLRWIAYLGDVGYTFLLWLNRVVNYYRFRKGLPYFSLSQYVKGKVKQAVSYIDDYESELAKMAKAKGCDGIICGHIHKPENRLINGIHYMNSGDWVESMSALAEDHEGHWELIFFNQMDFGKSSEKPEYLTRNSFENRQEEPLPQVAFSSVNDISFQTRSI